MEHNHFNTDKYVALAYGQPNGLKLQQRVEEHWREWCVKVNMAPWLLYWRRSLEIKQPAVTPRDEPCGTWVCGNVPLAIYTAAVWGFGIEGWLKIQSQTQVYTQTQEDIARPLSGIYRLRQERPTSEHRKYAWDEPLRKGCGMLLPSEFGELDRWLEPMWHEICNEARLSRESTSSK